MTVQPKPDDKQSLALVRQDKLTSPDPLAGASLVIVSTKGQSRTFPLGGHESVIGRAKNAEVCIDDRSISSQHAKMVVENGSHYLMDLGSTNGTFHNGRKLAPDEHARLVPGDTVQVAETVFAYVFGGTNAPCRPSASTIGP